MPLPSRKEDESAENFVNRCMSDDKTSKEFPDRKQRLAVCTSKAMEGLSIIQAVELAVDLRNYNKAQECECQKEKSKKESDGCGCRTKAKYTYENPKTGELFTYDRIGNYKKDGESLVYKGKSEKIQ